MKKAPVSMLFLFAASVAAEPQWCSGTLTNIYVSEGGEVTIRGTWRNEHTVICNLNQPRSNISVEVCKSWLSMALAAKMAKAEVTVYYSDVQSCGSIPAYTSSPSPGYFMLRE